MSVFTLSEAEREAQLLPRLAELTAHHRENSTGYDRILSSLGIERDAGFERIADLPWLPVRLFKTHDLKSIPDEEVFKTLTSSGTTGAGASRIYLDKDAAAAQTRQLGATLQEVLGPDRLPMLMVDTIGIIKNRRSFSARGAGVLGMANFGRKHTYVLDENDQPDVEAVKQFLAAYGDKPFLIFGFTFMVWQYLYEVAREHKLDLSNGILVHSGGWKKLIDRAVDNGEFRRRFKADTGLHQIYNYYGMIEQIGTVFLEGPSGNSLYCPDFADVVIRNPQTWEEQPVGEPGVIEVISTLPHSYPGHVLLTEDLGVCNGIDDGDWPGKHFSVLGRLPKAEARGCSDTFSGAAA
ncbi:LuxE/PaaK family acyltransferase [Amycolatopsis sp. H20-H5]|uniref:LuxE/PaaK family acyltransferase n=1 Tax=Amycolatopsis sp. H20-H5 TaxID=3046309 RepID=UPI002DBD85E3|nr:acyl-protein synthetase [Amycolatopsis sp. H20-H5]MEC3980542.1 acyl-protein synthetase [Amycolatopsis sp. H20-H5]